MTGLLQAVMAAMAIAHGAVAQPIDDGSGRDRPDLHASSQVGRTALFSAQTGGPDDEPLDGDPVDGEPVAQEPADVEDLDQGAPVDDEEDLDQGPPPSSSTASAIDDEPLDQGPPPTTSAPVPAAVPAPIPAPPPAAPVSDPAAIPAEPTGGKPIASSPKSGWKTGWPFDDGGGVFVNAGFGPGEASAAEGFDSCKQRVSNGRAYVGVNCSGADVVSGFTPPPWLSGTAESAQTVIRPASALSPSEWEPSSAPAAANTNNAAESASTGNTVYKEGKSRTRTRTITVNEDGESVAEDDKGDDDNGAATRSNRENRSESAQTANRDNGNRGGNDGNGGQASSAQKADKSGKKSKSKKNGAKKKDRKDERKKAKKQERRAERKAASQDERKAERQAMSQDDRKAARQDRRANGESRAGQRTAEDRASCRDRTGDAAGKRDKGKKDRKRACRAESRKASDS